MAVVVNGQAMICRCRFSTVGKSYAYKCNDITLNTGEYVIVPVGEDGEEKIARITGIQFCTLDIMPYPYDKMKTIIRRVTPEERATVEPIEPKIVNEAPSRPEDYKKSLFEKIFEVIGMILLSPILLIVTLVKTLMGTQIDSSGPISRDDL